jgi:membrane dipeptidase
MKPDEVIKACAERGGIIGIEAAPHTTLTPQQSRHTIDSYMAHFEYCCELVGIDHVAFGPDTIFGDHVGLHRVMTERLGQLMPPTNPPLSFERVEWVDGLESPAEAFPNIARWLVKHGYPDGEIHKVLGANILRLLGETWEPSK